jgi:hypothetical protein
MAKDKSSVIIYTDLIYVVTKLTDVKAGKLFKHLLAYVNDMNPSTDDPLIEVVFEPIKQQLKRDLIKYEKIRVKRSEAGQHSAEKRKQQNLTNSTSVESVEQNSTNSTVTDNVTDNVTVTDNDKIIINDNLQTNVQIVKSENFVRFETWILENAPQVAKMKEPFTEAQFIKLGKEFTREQIVETVQAMHNKKDLLKKYNSANLTLRSWINLKNNKTKNTQNGQSITTGPKSNPTDAYDQLANNLRGNSTT